MSLPTSQPIPDDEEDVAHMPPARKRRGRRMLIPTGSDQRAVFLDDLAHRVTPSFDFLLFSFLCGIIFGLGFLTNSPAILVLAALLAPFMGPMIGLSLATIIGSGRFFLLTLSGSLTGAALAFVSSAGMGLIYRFSPNLVFLQPGAHVQFEWSEALLLSVGAIVTTLSLLHSENRPSVPSVALAYALYLPVAAAGFGLTSGMPHLWPDGLIIFLVYLTSSTLLGTLVLAIQGFRPLNLFGYTLGTTIALTSLTVMIGLSGIGTAFQTQVALPTSQPTATPTLTQTATATSTSIPASSTPLPTHTLVPSKTPTLTASVAPTPVWATINSQQFNGAYIRTAPNFSASAVTSILNGSLVQVLPEVTQDGHTTWVHVRTGKGQEGWIVQDLLVTATPAPGW